VTVWLDRERVDEGRRNFLRALAGTPLLAALEGRAAAKPQRRPVRAAFIGVGGQGSVLLGRAAPSFIDVRAICDINPAHAAAAVKLAREGGHAPPKTYDDHRKLLASEDVEAVVVATPLWTHADVVLAALAAGKHVLCEKMMAYDVASARKVRDAAAKAGRLLEIGHQRFYNPIYTAAYEGIVKRGLLGEVYFARLGWHRNGSWRREEPLPAPTFDASAWGYPSFEHLLNWRLYRRYSQGLMAELGSHQVAIANWFYEAHPTSVQGSGAIARYRDGREVNDHVHATFEYPGGRVATYTSIQSNQLHGSYEEFLGTKGTLVLRGETEALFFPEGETAEAREARSAADKTLALAGATTPDAVSSASKKYEEAKRTTDAKASGPARRDGREAYRNELAGFCAAVRGTGKLACGPDRAFGAAVACITANAATDQHARSEIPT
jgi:predicted dehydrogenase